jgi:hypothetical protein
LGLVARVLDLLEAPTLLLLLLLAAAEDELLLLLLLLLLRGRLSCAMSGILCMTPGQV